MKLRGKQQQQLASPRSHTHTLYINTITLSVALHVYVNCVSVYAVLQVTEAGEHLISKVDADAEFIMGAVFDESLGDEVCVTIVATGVSPRMDAAAAAMQGKAVRQTQVVAGGNGGDSRSSSPNPFLVSNAAAAAKAEPVNDKPAGGAAAPPAAKPAGPAAGVQVPAFLRNMHRKK